MTTQLTKIATNFDSATDALIPLSQGKFAIVDKADFPALSVFRWHAVKAPNTWYAGCWIAGKKRKKIKMHAALTGWKRTDHVNGNGLDNRRSNLREATQAENLRNRKIGRNNTSGYKGVYLNRECGKYVASIYVDGHSPQHGYKGRRDDGTASRTEHEQMAAERVLADHRPHPLCKTIKGSNTRRMPLLKFGEPVLH